MINQEEAEMFKMICFNKMAKKYIISINDGQPYPFEQQNQTYEFTIVRVHTEATQIEHFKTIYEKVQKIIHVNCDQMMHILRVHERKGKSFTIDYEYVSKMLKKSSRLGEAGFVGTIKEKLTNFSTILASHGIKVNLNMDRIGLTKEGEPKVNVGLNFEIIPQAQRSRLLEDYRAMIGRFFEFNFGFRNSLKAQSEISQVSNKKLIEMEGKLNKLKLKNGLSSQDSSDSSGPSNNKEEVAPEIKKEEIVASCSLFSNRHIKLREHKRSYQEKNRSQKSQEDLDSSLKKRFTDAYQKTQQTINLYEEYTRNAKKH